MTSSDGIKSKLLELVADLRSQKTNLEKQITKIEADLQSVQRTVDLLYSGNTTDVVNKLHSQQALDVALIPFVANAKTQQEALRIMGRQNQNHIVNNTRAADVLIRAGLAKGKRRNLVITIHSIFNENTDEWVKVSAGNYQYIGD